MSEKQMILESFLSIKQIEKRMDRHGTEFRSDLDKIWTKLDEIKKDQNVKFENHEMRLVKSESEKNIFGKIIAPIISISSGLLGAWLGRHS